MEASCTKVYLAHGKDLNSSNSYCKQRLDFNGASRKLSRMTGCLEIIEGEDDGQSKICQDSASYGRPSSSAGDRPWSRGSIGCFPPRTDSSMSRRMNTPTKQISLQAVRRKEESTEPFVDQVEWQQLTLENNRQIWKPETNTGYPEPAKKLVQADGFRLEAVAETSWQLNEQLLSQPNKVMSKVTSQTETIVEAAEGRGVSNREKNREEKNTDDSDEGEGDDDDDSDSSEEEEEKLRAPNELLMEFVDCLMRKDFQTASKLCKMILLYEPENPEALKFQPLIEEKLELDAEAEKEAAEESSDDDDDSDDESEDDGNDASEDEDEDSGSDSSEEDDDGSDDDDCDGGNNASGSNSNNNNEVQGSCWQRHLK